MKLDASYFRTFRIGNLFFKFIYGTPLESQGWTGEKLAELLQRQGFIKIVEIQPTNKLGQFQPKEKRYVELPGKQISRRELLKMLVAS